MPTAALESTPMPASSTPSPPPLYSNATAGGGALQQTVFALVNASTETVRIPANASLTYASHDGRVTLSVPEQAFNNSQELLLEMQLGMPLPGTLQAGMVLLSEILAMSILPTTAHQLSKPVDIFLNVTDTLMSKVAWANASSPAFANTSEVKVTAHQHKLVAFVWHSCSALLINNHIHIHIHIHIHTYAYTHMHTHTHAHTHTYAYTHICIHTHTYAYTHTHMHTHMHTHTHNTGVLVQQPHRDVARSCPSLHLGV
jgi:hypothetical protein